MKALLFGSAGTVCDTSHLQLAAYNRSFVQHGLSWQWPENTFHDLLKITGPRNRLRFFSQMYTGSALSEEKIEAVLRDAQQFLLELITPESVRLRPGVLRLIHDAREQDVKVGLVTTTSRSRLDVIECALNCSLPLSELDVVIDRDMVHEPKPCPEAYRLALGALNCRAEYAVAIEDSVPCVKAPKAAGIATVATPHRLSGYHNLKSADAVVNHLGEADYPASLLHGAKVCKRRMVTIDSLSRALLGVMMA